VAEAMMACVLADAFLRHRGQTGGGAFRPGEMGRS
jgi:chorismate synthase